MKDIPTMFGSMVFNDAAMQARLPKEIYRSLKSSIMQNVPLALEIADFVANAMKDWATEKALHTSLTGFSL